MIEIAFPCPQTGRARLESAQGWPVTATWGVAWRPARGDWSVTHLPTGRSAYSTRNTVRAVECARELGAIFDVWVGKPGSEPSFGPHAASLLAVVEKYQKGDERPPFEIRTGRLSERRVVYVATPWRTAPGHDRAARVAYVRRAVKDSLDRGESPVAPHLMLHGVLDDDRPSERQIGIDAGLAVLGAVERLVVYEDHGITDGMEAEIEAAREMGMPIEYRRLSGGSA